MSENNHVPWTAAICNVEQAWHTNILQNTVTYSRSSWFVCRISLQSVNAKKTPSRIIDLLLSGSQAVWICDPAHDLCERNHPRGERNRIRGKIRYGRLLSPQKSWQQYCEFISLSIFPRIRGKQHSNNCGISLVINLFANRTHLSILHYMILSRKLLCICCGFTS